MDTANTSQRLNRSSSTPRTRKQGAVQSALINYWYILPTFIFLAVFMYYPALSALYHSFFQWDGTTQAQFIGLDNFVHLFNDPLILRSFANVLRLTLWGIAVTTIIPLIVARLIFEVRNKRIQYIIRVLFVVPSIVPQVVIWFVWAFIYDPVNGLANQLLKPLGLQSGWLGDSTMALYALMFMEFPFVFALPLLIYSAGLLGIPQEVRDAAAVDGASGIERMRLIELPLLYGQVRLVAVLAILGAVQNFAYILVMTKGGPGDATVVPALAMYRYAFSYNQMGYASAIGAVMFVLILVLGYLNLRAVRSANDYEA